MGRLWGRSRERAGNRAGAGAARSGAACLQRSCRDVGGQVVSVV